MIKFFAFSLLLTSQFAFADIIQCKGIIKDCKVGDSSQIQCQKSHFSKELYPEEKNVILLNSAVVLSNESEGSLNRITLNTEQLKESFLMSDKISKKNLLLRDKQIRKSRKSSWSTSSTRKRIQTEEIKGRRQTLVDFSCEYL